MSPINYCSNLLLVYLDLYPGGKLDMECKGQQGKRGNNRTGKERRVWTGNVTRREEENRIKE